MLSKILVRSGLSRLLWIKDVVSHRLDDCVLELHGLLCLDLSFTLLLLARCFLPDRVAFALDCLAPTFLEYRDFACLSTRLLLYCFVRSLILLVNPGPRPRTQQLKAAMTYRENRTLCMANLSG